MLLHSTLQELVFLPVFCLRRCLCKPRCFYACPVWWSKSTLQVSCKPKASCRQYRPQNKCMQCRKKKRWIRLRDQSRLTVHNGTGRPVLAAMTVKRDFYYIQGLAVRNWSIFQYVFYFFFLIALIKYCRNVLLPPIKKEIFLPFSVRYIFKKNHNVNI